MATQAAKIIETGLATYGLNVSSIAAGLAIITAIYVIITKNPIISVLFLIGLFVVVAVYLMFLGLGFLGLAYLLVYVGAVSILFLFILMLINVRISELVSETRNTIPLVFITVLSFGIVSDKFTPFYKTLVDYVNDKNILSFVNSIFEGNPLNRAFPTNWENALVGQDHINSIGNIMYTSHNIWIILVSLILLLAMVGTIVITVKDKDYTPRDINTNNVLTSGIVPGMISSLFSVIYIVSKRALLKTPVKAIIILIAFAVIACVVKYYTLDADQYLMAGTVSVVLSIASAGEVASVIKNLYLQEMTMGELEYLSKTNYKELNSNSYAMSSSRPRGNLHSGGRSHRPYEVSDSDSDDSTDTAANSDDGRIDPENPPMHLLTPHRYEQPFHSDPEGSDIPSSDESTYTNLSEGSGDERDITNNRGSVYGGLQNVMGQAHTLGETTQRQNINATGESQDSMNPDNASGTVQSPSDNSHNAGPSGPSVTERPNQYLSSGSSRGFKISQVYVHGDMGGSSNEGQNVAENTQAENSAQTGNTNTQNVATNQNIATNQNEYTERQAKRLKRSYNDFNAGDNDSGEGPSKTS